MSAPEPTPGAETPRLTLHQLAEAVAGSDVGGFDYLADVKRVEERLRPYYAQPPLPAAQAMTPECWAVEYGSDLGSLTYRTEADAMEVARKMGEAGRTTRVVALYTRPAVPSGAMTSEPKLIGWEPYAFHQPAPTVPEPSERAPQSTEDGKGNRR